ncbi:hypothetical protein [Methylomonas koyamae]|uniref:Bbp19 family protein n=1 Tax=Methylomonas koyamae TaxID=702114 RepID=UPI00112B904E|nr:hypothetical protein [Methylomonas koyamae]TPQ24929.1 hypothetical protein C2U68_17275 [Methylomonas koyamae]
MSNHDTESLKRQREQEDRQRALQKLNQAKDLSVLLSMPEGRRFLRRLLHLCGVYRISYVAGDTHATAYREGARNIGNLYLAEIQAQPELFFQLITEDDPHDYSK